MGNELHSIVLVLSTLRGEWKKGDYRQGGFYRGEGATKKIIEGSVMFARQARTKDALKR